MDEHKPIRNAVTPTKLGADRGNHLGEESSIMEASKQRLLRTRKRATHRSAIVNLANKKPQYYLNPRNNL